MDEYEPPFEDEPPHIDFGNSWVEHDTDDELLALSPNPRLPFVTIGVGRKNPQGEAHLYDSIEDLVKTISGDTTCESWWSPGQFGGDLRSKEMWEASIAVAIDLDWYGDNGKHSAPSSDVREKLASMNIGATLSHATPRGHRLVYVFVEPITDAKLFVRAARGVMDMVRMQLKATGLLRDGGPGFEVDDCATDRARQLFSARCLVEGEQTPRTEDIQVTGGLFDAKKLSSVAPDVQEKPRQGKRYRDPAESTTRYVETALYGELERVRSAVEGSRNSELNRAAYSLGQLVAGGVLKQSRVESELLAAAVYSGLGEHESKRTIASGLRSGAEEPRGVPEREKLSTQHSDLPEVNSGNGITTAQPDDSDKVYDLILNPRKPLDTARRFVADLYTTDGLRTLVRVDGEDFIWGHGHYKLAKQDELTQEIYRYLDRAQYWVKEEKEFVLVPYCPTRSKVDNVIHALSEVTLHKSASDPSWIVPGKYPADEILACANGLLHVPSRTLLPSTPSLFTRSALPLDFDPNAGKPALWLRFLDDILPGDQEAIDLVQEMFGLLVCGDTRYQKIFLLIGQRRCGKGTLCRVLNALLGDGYAGPTFNSLGTNFGLQSLLGKRVAVVADARLSGKTDQTPIVERLLSISGEDALTVDRKNKSHWCGKLPVRFVILSNEIPQFSDVSGALASRFVVVEFRQSFFGSEDVELTDKLIKELPAIFLWALDGYDRLRTRGKFIYAASAASALEEIEEMLSPFGAFIAEHGIVDPDAVIPSKVLYDAWRTWCAEQGRSYPGSAQTLRRNLRAIGIDAQKAVRRVDGKNTKVFLGVTLRDFGSRTTVALPKKSVAQCQQEVRDSDEDDRMFVLRSEHPVSVSPLLPKIGSATEIDNEKTSTKTSNATDATDATDATYLETFSSSSIKNIGGIGKVENFDSTGSSVNEHNPMDRDRSSPGPSAPPIHIGTNDFDPDDPPF